MTDTATGPRTLVLGDSWVHGLSKGQGTLSRLLPAALGAREVLDLSKVSRITTEIVDDHLQQIEAFAPEFALMATGGADSLIFPAPWFQHLIDRFAPPDWQGVEGLQPSAMVVRDKRKLRRHRIETTAKALLKQIVVNLFGGRRRVPLAQYELAARVVLAALEACGATVVLVGTSDVDGWTSPKSTKNIRAANAVSRRLAEQSDHAIYVDSAELVDKWDDYLIDHVHLSRDGHKKVCEHVLVEMRAAGGAWRAFADRQTPAPVAQHAG